MKYWIQRADFSAQDLEAGSVSDLCSAFERHDWAAEEEFRLTLESDGKECCPPGFGVVPGDGRILHICPDAKGSAQYHYHYSDRRRLLGIIPLGREATITWDGQSADACEVIEFFVADRHEDLINHSRRVV